MIFNKDKQIASQIADTLLPYFEAPFLEYKAGGGSDKIPTFIFEDQYVVGFIFGLSSLLLNFDFNGKSMPVSRRGDIQVNIIKSVCKEKAQTVCDLIMQNTENKNDQDEGFKRGSHDAGSLYGLVNGTLKDGGLDHLVLEAKNLANKMSDNIADYDAQDALAGAFTMLSIKKRINQLLQN